MSSRLSRRRQLDQLADRLELGPIRAFRPLEEDGFRCGNHRSRLFETAEGVLPIDPGTRADGVDNHLDPKAQVHQFESGLGHAYVRFDTGESNMADVPADKCSRKGATEQQ